jgi:hypothetical protein
MESSGGATEREVRRLRRRFVVLLRTAVLVGVGGAAVAQASADRLPLVVGVGAVLVAWSVVYARYAPRRWLLVADTLVIIVLCLAQRWLVPPESLPDSTNWVLAIVTISAVAHQWFSTTAGGALLATALVAAHLTGNALASPEIWATSVPLGLWTFGEAALSRVLYLLVHAGARQADQTIATSEQARRDAMVAAARRVDEREYLAILHDTAAGTLLAVGTRMVEGTEPWLVRQAARDLEILAAQPDFADRETDLARLLDTVAQQAPVTVELRTPRPMLMPAAPAAAIGAAVREALTNVARHAGVPAAELIASRTNGIVTVEITDRGRGFAPDEVPAHRRGVSESIEQRMARLGGRAVVITRPGAGTRVRLEWPDE